MTDRAERTRHPLQVWEYLAVTRLISSGYVLATTERHARERGASLSGLSAREVEAHVVTGAVVHKLRCGQVGVDVAWVAAKGDYLVCVTHQGRRNFVDVDPDTQRGVIIPAPTAYEDAAREALQVLVDADDVDDGLLLWERAGDEDRLVVRRVP